MEVSVGLNRVVLIYIIQNNSSGRRNTLSQCFLENFALQQWCSMRAHSPLLHCAVQQEWRTTPWRTTTSVWLMHQVLLGDGSRQRWGTPGAAGTCSRPPQPQHQAATPGANIAWDRLALGKSTLALTAGLLLVLNQRKASNVFLGLAEGSVSPQMLNGHLSGRRGFVLAQGAASAEAQCNSVLLALVLLVNRKSPYTLRDRDP